MIDRVKGAHIDAAINDEANANLRNVTEELAAKPDNGDDRDIFGQALEDKLATEQHEEYMKENN